MFRFSEKEHQRSLCVGMIQSFLKNIVFVSSDKAQNQKIFWKEAFSKQYIEKQKD